MNVNGNNSNMLSSLNQLSHVDVLSCLHNKKVIALLGKLQQVDICMLHNITLMIL